MSAPIYRGYSRVARTGINTELYDHDLVKQDLLNHFQTRLGEAVGRPGFGRIIHDLLFDVRDRRTEALCHADAQRIIRADPRVQPLEINVDVRTDIGQITMEIKLFFIEFNMSDWFSVTFSERN